MKFEIKSFAKLFQKVNEKVVYWSWLTGPLIAEVYMALAAVVGLMWVTEVYGNIYLKISLIATPFLLIYGVLNAIMGKAFKELGDARGSRILSLGGVLQIAYGLSAIVLAVILAVPVAFRASLLSPTFAVKIAKNLLELTLAFLAILGLSAIAFPLMYLAESGGERLRLFGSALLLLTYTWLAPLLVAAISIIQYYFVSWLIVASAEVKPSTVFPEIASAWNTLFSFLIPIAALTGVLILAQMIGYSLLGLYLKRVR